jgi:hypothetical protein
VPNKDACRRSFFMAVGMTPIRRSIQALAAILSLRMPGANDAC